MGWLTQTGISSTLCIANLARYFESFGFSNIAALSVNLTPGRIGGAEAERGPALRRVPWGPLAGLRLGRAPSVLLSALPLPLGGVAKFDPPPAWIGGSLTPGVTGEGGSLIDCRQSRVTQRLLAQQDRQIQDSRSVFLRWSELHIAARGKYKRECLAESQHAI